MPSQEWMSERQIVDIRIRTSTSPAPAFFKGKSRRTKGAFGASNTAARAVPFMTSAPR